MYCQLYILIVTCLGTYVASCVRNHDQFIDTIAGLYTLLGFSHVFMARGHQLLYALHKALSKIQIMKSK